jgi:hypothetical protein
MNILGVGSLELFLIIMITLIVAGPKRMLVWSNIAGRYFVQARILLGKMVEQAQKELDENEIPIQLPRQLPTNPTELARLTKESLKPLEKPLQQATKAYEREIKKVDDEIRGVLDNVSDEASVEIPPLFDSSQPAKSAPASDLGSWADAVSSEDQE